MSKVIAVVVNWNGRDDTLACLASMANGQRRPTTIMVDNASQDGSVTAVRAAFPDVQIIPLARNRHFAAGANAGLRRGLDQDAAYLCLLNNDVLVTPGALAEMVRVADADPHIGVVGARLVHPTDPPGVIVGARCHFRTGAIHEPPPPADAATDRLAVDYVWGCAMLIRAATLRQIGLLDESLVAYFEDTDFCLRARRHGWQTVTALRAVVYHAGSKSSNRAFWRQMWLRGRNWWRVYWRHAPAAERPLLCVWLLGWRLPGLAWSALVTGLVRTWRGR